MPLALDPVSVAVGEFGRQWVPFGLSNCKQCAMLDAWILWSSCSSRGWSW
jgi:hypothetical protein